MNYYGKLVKKNDKLVHTNNTSKKLYEDFIKNLPENSIVEFYADVSENNGTLAQIAKIHAMIRSLSNHTGNGFEEMKLYVKEKAGMCYIHPSSSKMICKSFGDCSKEELSYVIQTITEISHFLNYPL